MSKRYVHDGYMVIESDTRVTIWPINTEDKYQYLLRVFSELSGIDETRVDAKITKLMAKMPTGDV